MQKLFFITSISLFLSAFVMYLVVYAVLPSYYTKYKKRIIISEVNTLIDKVKKVEFNNATGFMDAFANRNNVSINIYDSFGGVVYSATTYLSVIYSNKNEEVLLVPGKNSIIQNKAYSSQFYTYTQNIMFKDIPVPLRVTVTAALQPINEASEVILSLGPYIFILILGISGIGAYVYSKFVAEPLLKVNKTAKKMAELDFETRCIVKSDDEIGEIANSLNELSEKLKVTMDELEERNRQLKSDIEREREIESKRREFVATISHELKSPIAAAKGQIEGMINNIGVFKDREKYLRRSYSTINNMEKLVSEIIDMSKLENYDFAPKFLSVNLSDLVNKIIRSEEYLSLSKNLIIEDNIEEDLKVLADEKLITKALSNIINNALKYSPEGEKVTINLYKNNDGIVFKVVNTGVYIEESDIKEVFKPFYRVEKSRNRSTGGSGLGLYIVQNILDTHGLKYNLSSNESQVEFTVNFHI